MRFDNVHQLVRSYERSAELDEDEEDPYAAADMRLCRNIQAYVDLHYPGHPWMITVRHGQGIVTVSLPTLMGQNCYTIFIDSLHTDPGFRSIIRACGEILERYQLPRAGYSHDQFRAAEARYPPWLRRQSTPVPV